MGTEVVLHMREGEDELLTGYRLRPIIQKSSDHISLPILMPNETATAGAGPVAGAEPAGGEAGGEPPGETVVNQASALWARPKSEISAQDYHQLYKHIAHDFAGPLADLAAQMQTTYEYTLPR